MMDLPQNVNLVITVVVLARIVQHALLAILLFSECLLARQHIVFVKNVIMIQMYIPVLLVILPAMSVSELQLIARPVIVCLIENYQDQPVSAWTVIIKHHLLLNFVVLVLIPV